MRAVKGKETSLEQQLRINLWYQGIRYRKNSVKLFGKPDISIKKKKVVIFVDSCFWHGCDKHLRLPKSNRDYWLKKIEKNKIRDIEVNEYYKTQNWKIVRVWEHEIKFDIGKSLNKILSIIQ